MTEHEPIRRCWAQEAPEDPAARHLAETLRPTLSAAQLARVEARLAASLRTTPAASASPAQGSRHRAGVLIGAAAFTAGLVLGLFVPALLRPERPTAVSLPPVASPRSLPVQIALLGAGELLPAGPASPLRLRRGGLLLRTEEVPVLVQCQSAAIKISPHSLVEVVSDYQGSTLVAAYSGSAAVRWQAREREVTLASGQAATNRGPVSLPARRSALVGAFRFGSEPAGSVLLPPLDAVLDSKTQPSPELRRAPEQQTPSPSQSANRISPRPPIAPTPPPSPISTDTRERDTLLGEQLLLDSAMARLRTAHDPSGALALLEEYSAQFPQGNLRHEAELLRTNVLLALGRKQEALRGLDAQALADGTPRAPEQRVVRGELRAAAGRCGEAISDFDSVLGRAQGELLERALYGRSRCRAQLGEVGPSRNDLAEYLRRFPNGRFSAAARKLFLAPPETNPPPPQDR